MMQNPNQADDKPIFSPTVEAFLNETEQVNGRIITDRMVMEI